RPFSGGMEGTARRLWTCPDPQRHEPFPLDLSGSGEHSYGCPFGPPRIAEVWQHQRSRFGPNGQPPESSQLGTIAAHLNLIPRLMLSGRSAKDGGWFKRSEWGCLSHFMQIGR